MRLYFGCMLIILIFMKTEVKGDLEEGLRKEFEVLQAWNFNDDCNAKNTKKALQFLSLTQANLEDPGLTETKAGFKPDCSLRLTKLHQLRQYLKQKNFLTNPGSLVFLNAQATNIRLFCGIDDAAWSAQGLHGDLSKDKNFHFTKDELAAVAPEETQYFRKYLCTSSKAKCSHISYVISRPQPKINFPLQFAEGNDVEIECHLNECLYKKCELFTGRPQPLYSFKWSLPPYFNPKPTHPKTKNYTCQNGADESVKHPLYFSFTAKNSSMPPVVNPPPINAMIELTGKVKNLVNDFGENFDEVLVESKIKIKGAMELHRGHFECIIIDGNGVPSMPNAGTINPKSIHYTGRALLHVRGHIWSIVPGVFIILIVVILIAIHLVCPLKMEHEDGTPYTKDEIIGPK